MATVSVAAEASVGAPARLVYDLITNFLEHHPRFLPNNFSDLEVEQGGVGAGTIITFTVSALGRERRYRLRIDEPVPGRVMIESDTLSDMVTTWTVTPEGDASRVRIETRWEGAEGMPGFFEGLLVPPTMRRIYNEELRRLDRYAQAQTSRELVGSGRH
jgi:hypothetical protein